MSQLQQREATFPPELCVLQTGSQAGGDSDQAGGGSVQGAERRLRADLPLTLPRSQECGRERKN